MLSPRGRGHFSSLITLALEAVSKNAPTVSFVHSFPGFVKTNFGNDVKGVAFTVMRTVFDAVIPLIRPFIATPVDEARERQVFFATSARFPEGGIPLPKDIFIARGTNGKSASGVYSVSNDGETASPEIEQLFGEVEEGWLRA